MNVSRNTVDNAYSQLAAEGYIIPKRGIGYAVAGLPKLKPGRATKCVTAVKPVSAKTDGVIYDLTNSSHTRDLFPKTLWRRYMLDCLEQSEYETAENSLQDMQGERKLRRSLLNYLERIRGICCGEGQIIITCGIQQSLAYICSILPKDQTNVYMEEPGYNKAAAVFLNHGMQLKPVPLDENGIMTTALPSGMAGGVVYTTPSHQFPTGVTMPVGRRYELLEWAKNHDSYIIEDDYDSELRYYAKPIPALQSIDTDDRVIYLGTFSKALSPSMRMGYMILPPVLMKAYLDKYRDYNSTVPRLNQYVIARLIETGQYDRHVRRMNHIFRKRLERFLEEFADVKDKIRISDNGSGQYFLLEFLVRANQNELIEAALKCGVRVYPTMQFWQSKADCPPNTLFLGFSKIDLEDISDCVKRLKTAWKKWF